MENFLPETFFRLERKKMFLRRETQKLEFLSSFFTFENLPQNEQNVNPYYKVQ